MPIPLLWLGAGLAALYAGNELSKSHYRRTGIVGRYPGETDQPVVPRNGAIVSCGIYAVFDHTGIWADGDIIERKGNGLIRGISPARFMDNRSGNTIFVACDSGGEPFSSQQAYNRATSQLFSYADYDVLSNNCHRFVWHCISGAEHSLTRFAELNEKLSHHFGDAVHWHPAKLSPSRNNT